LLFLIVTVLGALFFILLAGLPVLLLILRFCGPLLLLLVSTLVRAFLIFISHVKTSPMGYSSLSRRNPNSVETAMFLPPDAIG
jgi:hypothetical protein